MDFSEKLLTLRKANNLTQEQLAEQLEVSRQSVSKWESGQAVPELEKIVALSAVFDVTTDYLLKASEIDDLSVKTTMLEKQQQLMLDRERKQRKRFDGILCTVAVYLLFFAVCLVEKGIEFRFNVWIFPDFIFAEFFIASAVVILIWVKKFRKTK